ncbi:MAG: efflux RND transporter periplasmic adaptor subunit [Planctomycetes bacterium]|nr:efflux RND transporter periplasmic adaptor subunit [Planctomycetota bacterium]
MSQHKSWRAIQFGAVAMVLGAMAACGPATGPGPDVDPNASFLTLVRQAPSTTAVVSVSEAQLWREVPTSVRSLDHISVSAEVNGRVMQVHAEVGDRVEKGQPLATLDDSVLTSMNDSAKAALELATAEKERVQRLVDAKVASQRELDAAQSVYKRALAAVDLAQTDLKRTVVRAPVNGIVEARLNGPGDLAFPGKPLYSLYDPTRLVLDVQIPIADRHAVDLGMELPWAIGTHQSSSKVTEIAPSSDPRSRTLRVRLELGQQPQEFLRTLAPGTFGVLRYSAGNRPFVAIPQQALRQVGQVQMVLVQDEFEQWRRRAVRTGNRRGGEIEILSGLIGGETVGWTP